MPAIKIHEAISKQRTGETYTDLHAWIDEGKGVDHRSKRHYYTKTYKDYVFKKFGGHKAVSEWLFHIVLDNLSTLVKNDKYYHLSSINFFKFGFEESGFMRYDGQAVDDLKKEFCN